ncbi:23126_t:CDS:2, partial [Gigaspora rosea]
EYTGCIQARDIANIGAWTTFFLRDLGKLQLKLIERPNSDISTPSIPKNPWTISLLNDTNICVKRLKKENVKKHLKTRGILKDMNINKKELVKELESVLVEETLAKTLEAHMQNKTRGKKETNIERFKVSIIKRFWIQAIGFRMGTKIFTEIQKEEVWKA